MLFYPSIFQANNDFKKHTQNIVEMKKDLDSIFKRLKIIKQKLNKQMPEAYDAVIAAGERATAREEDDEYDIALRERRRVKESLGTTEEAEEASGDIKTKN